jgi:AraC-like DNA-binding protein
VNRFLHFVDRCQEVSGIADTGNDWRPAFRHLLDRPFREFSDHERVLAQALLLNVFLHATVRSKRRDIHLTPRVHRMVGDQALRDALLSSLTQPDRGPRGAHVDRPPVPDPRVRRGIAYLRRYCSDPGLTLDAIARHSRLSKWHFDRLLKSGTGVGFREHLRSVRLAKARNLLVTSTLAVKEIAARVGYKYTSVFSRQFKLRFGLTPTSYRQRNLK